MGIIRQPCFCVLVVMQTTFGTLSALGQDLFDQSRPAIIHLQTSPTNIVDEDWYFDHVQACSAVLRHHKVVTSQFDFYGDGEVTKSVQELRENYVVRFGEISSITTEVDGYGNPVLHISGSSTLVWSHRTETQKKSWTDPKVRADDGPLSTNKTLQATIYFPGCQQYSSSAAENAKSTLLNGKPGCVGQSDFVDSVWLNDHLDTRRDMLPISTTAKTPDELRASASEYVNKYTDWDSLNDSEIGKIHDYLVNNSVDDAKPFEDFVASPCTLWLRQVEPAWIEVDGLRLGELRAPGMKDEITTKYDAKSIVRTLIWRNMPGGSRDDQSKVIITFSSPQIERRFNEAMFFLIKGCQQPSQ